MSSKPSTIVADPQDADKSLQQAQDAQPFAPIPAQGPKPAAAAATESKSKEISQKAGEALTSMTSTQAPSAPAAKAAAAKAPAEEVAAADATKAAVKPATVAGKSSAGDVAGAAEQQQKKPAKDPADHADVSVPAAGKAAALVSGGTAATAKATAAAAAKAKALAPTSAGAILGDKTLVTAVERQQKIGSVLASGAGAVAEPAVPKAKAKAGASTAAAPKAPSTTGYPTAVEATGPPPVAPASVIDIVTGTPQPVLESSTNAPTARSAIAKTTTPTGPARAYAKVAAPALSQAASGSAATTFSAASQKSPELPTQGPAAVAVGRAVSAGAGDTIKFKGAKASVPIGKKYQIIFVTSEVAPYSKTGGLGEAMDGLPTALAALGHRVMVISPRYDQYKEAWDTDFWSSVKMAGKDEKVHFFHIYKQKVDHIFVDHPSFLERVDGLSGAKLYGPEWGKDFADNQARFAYFCKAALVAIKDLPLGGFVYGHQSVVVANDWHSALLPMFVHAQRSADPTMWKDTKTAFLCHNSMFQGRFEYEEGLAKVFDVPQQYIDSITFTMPLKVGKYNKKVKCVNTMAAGVRYSDRALTVSPSYAKECATDPEKGVELERFFALGRVTGILNGVKEGVSPSDQNFVAKTKMQCGTFTAETAIVAKEQLKADYRTESGLPESAGPLMCFVGRLDVQKGYDLLLEALIEVLEDTEVQVVIVGSGRADLVEQTKAVEKKFPTKFFYAGWMGPERYALLAGCDWTLLPSRWEPCGLVQMEAMRMGTLPIVAPTGGLRDTVEDGINGIWTDAEMTVEAEIDDESVASIARALRRAVDIHVGSPAKEATMKRAAMAAAEEFTWSNAALQYESVFEELGVKDLLPLSHEKAVTLEVDKQVC